VRHALTLWKIIYARRMKEDDFEPIAWPDIPRICFGPADDWQFNACVGWAQSSPRNMLGYVEGYRRAAIALFESVVAPRTMSPDWMIFPIAFLWRQHIELALKDIIAIGRELQEEKWGFPATHQLSVLWNEAKLHILACGDPNAPELTNVQANIIEFEKIDPGSEGFRYPVGRDLSTRSLPNAPDDVNLRALHEAMVALGNFFEGVRSELGTRLDYQQEMWAEACRNS
jgi:hypothetical protein